MSIALWRRVIVFDGVTSPIAKSQDGLYGFGQLPPDGALLIERTSTGEVMTESDRCPAGGED